MNHETDEKKSTKKGQVEDFDKNMEGINNIPLGKNQKKSLLTSSLYNRYSIYSTSTEGSSQNDSVIKTSLNMSLDGKVPSATENYSKILSELPDLYSQSISSSLSSFPVSESYSRNIISELQDRTYDENFGYSLSSFSASDIYEETDSEFSFISNNVKVYQRQNAKKYYTQNNKMNSSDPDKSEEFLCTELLKFTEKSIDHPYQGETFNSEKIDNVSHYHCLLTQFLLELLKNKCSEYFFVFHDVIQFQYKVFKTCEQFTREGQEIFNTYLTNASNLKIDIDTKLVHKIAYGIKYYDQNCFIPLTNMVLKFLESQYLNCKENLQTTFDIEGK